MAPDFIVTVDTEADDEWSHAAPASYRNIGRLPNFQALCDRYGIRPTYLTTYDVATDAAACETLQGLVAEGHCEIGAHLHAWSTPPHHELTAAPDARQPYLHEYPPQVQREKLICLDEALRERLGVAPVTYRGGRWSLDPTSANLLAEMGYLADTTVTPGLSWERNPGCSPGAVGSSFAAAPATPYRLHHQDICLPGQLELLEVPVSIIKSGPLAHIPAPRVAPQRLIGRMMSRSGLCRPMWLRPGFSSAGQMIEVCDALAASGAPVLNLMFHSSELLPGGSPKVATAEQSQAFWQSLEAVFAHVTSRLGARPLMLREYAEQWWAGHRDRAREELAYAF